ncbi:2-methylcitrate synthase [Spirochaetota bacterium]|nr:2-methylcitrate synthase [Spirochaetota bacterium]
MTDIKKGLQGVIADTSAISQVVAETSTLTYRGYKVSDLSEHTSFEEVCWLLLYGELPTEAQLATFKSEERAARQLPANVEKMLAHFPLTCHPMDVMRSFVSMIGMEAEMLADGMQAVKPEMAIRLLGCMPVCVAWDICRRLQRPLTPPDLNLSMSENFFKMVFGKIPDPPLVRAFDVSLILYAEHSFNASTFTARIITSTLSDYYSSITGAIGALKGPLHGGANEAVMRMFEKIGTASEAEAWVMNALRNKELIMGFGHRVYRTGDSRVPTMKKHFLEVARNKNDTQFVDLYENVASVVMREKGLHPNLDYPSAPLYSLLGFATDFFTPIFVMSRLAGWSAHIIEQQANNRLIRPICAYTGEVDREVIPLAERR